MSSIKKKFQDEIKALKAIKPFDRKPNKQKEIIAVIGGGWSGVKFVTSIDPEKYDVYLISKTDHFCYNPLLTSVLSGLLKVKNVTQKLTEICHPKIHIIHDIVKEIDFENNQLLIGEKKDRMIKYDYLVNASGTQTNDFGIKGIADNTYYLKTADEAAKFRNKLNDLKNITKRDIHVAVVGGGPSGVESAAEVSDEFSDLGRSNVTISLIEMFDKLLPMYTPDASQVTYDTLNSRENVSVLLNTRLLSVNSDALTLSSKKNLDLPDQYILKSTRDESDNIITDCKYDAILWVSGIKQQDISAKLMQHQFEMTGVRKPGIIVDQNLKALHFDNVYSIGDTAFMQPPKIGQYDLEELKSYTKDELAQFFPQIADNRYYNSYQPGVDIDESYKNPAPTAQTASQHGAYLAGLFNKYDMSTNTIKPCFKHDYQGAMCYIGNERAVLELHNFGNWNGFPKSGLLWRAIYAWKQLTFRKSLQVANQFFLKCN